MVELPATELGQALPKFHHQNYYQHHHSCLQHYQSYQQHLFCVQTNQHQNQHYLFITVNGSTIKNTTTS